MEKMNAVSDTIKDFTPLKRERYNSLHSTYGESAVTIVENVKARGENSWPNVQRKCTELSRARGAEAEYNNLLEETLLEADMLTEDTIIQIVTEVRSDAGLPAFVTQIKKQCLKEFFKLFIFDEERTAEGVKKYNIKCNLLSKD